MTRRMFHMKREHNEMRSPAPLAGIEEAERVGSGRRTAVQRQKRACMGFCGEIAYMSRAKRAK